MTGGAENLLQSEVVSGCGGRILLPAAACIPFELLVAETQFLGLALLQDGSVALQGHYSTANGPLVPLGPGEPALTPVGGQDVFLALVGP